MASPKYSPLMKVLVIGPTGFAVAVVRAFNDLIVYLHHCFPIIRCGRCASAGD